MLKKLKNYIQIKLWDNITFCWVLSSFQETNNYIQIYASILKCLRLLRHLKPNSGIGNLLYRYIQKFKV